jgi:hypothetical protein
MWPVYSCRCADVDEPAAIYPVGEGNKFHTLFIKFSLFASNPYLPQGTDARMFNVLHSQSK